MVHPIIEVLRQAPYKYEIEQPSNHDDSSYLFQCPDGIKLKIHVDKPVSMWSGIGANEKRVERKNFTKDASAKALEFGRAFNIVKMDLKDNAQKVADFKPSDVVKPNVNQADPHCKETKPRYKQTSLTVTEASQIISESTTLKFTDGQMEAMMGTVAKGANKDEFTMLMHLAQFYGLDPFLHEIYYVSQMKTIMTSRDGYLKIAQRHKSFMGIQSMAVREFDDFEVDLDKHTVKHKFGKGERGKIIGAWAIVYRDGRFPQIAYADLSEYKGNSTPWVKYTSAMICKCAEAFALKRQFGISGLVTREEMDYHDDGDPEIVDAKYVNMDAIDAEYTVVEKEEE